MYNQIRYLGKYLRPHRTVLIFSFSLSALSTALGMIQPYFARVLIDKVFLAREARLLFPLLSTLIALLAAGFLIRVTNSYIYTLYSAKLLFKMREDLFAHLQKIPLSFLSKKKGGDIFSRISTDMADIQGFATDTIPHFLFDSLTCVITAAILFWLNWRMALMSFCFLPVAVFIVNSIRPGLSTLAKAVAESNSDIAHLLFEAFGGASVVRAFGAEKLECNKLEAKHSHMLKYLLRYQMLGAFAGSAPTILMIVNTLIVFGYGGLLVVQGGLTVGSLVAFSIYQGRVFAPLQGLLDGLMAIPKSRVALDRVMELTDIPPACPRTGEITLEERRLQGDIAFENVSFSYETGEPVIGNLSFRIPAGKITALIGPSGSGKTTICHLLLRLFDPDAGRITVDGIDLREYRMDWLRKRMALVSQDTFLFHASILENIRYAKPESGDEEIIEAAKAACVHGFVQTLPDGYHAVVGDRGVRLSGGQKQRISIARSILLNPKILILDEATAFLDSSVEERLRETVRSLMEDRTILLVSHRRSTIQGAERTIALDNGCLTYEGPAEGFQAFSRSRESETQ
ncbi:MAG: ABC transporter ATP-binding protein [Candidatus Lindowbacteria bacterium]|nr:ABC transporter ATP-binding protein [Candidatus Lindowbacteria bacterium]